MFSTIGLDFLIRSIQGRYIVEDSTITSQMFYAPNAKKLNQREIKLS